MRRRSSYPMILGLLVIMVAVNGCGKNKGEVLAKVGDNAITTSDFKYALSNLPENYKVLAESYKGKRKILENLVKKDLLVQEAENRGFQDDKEIKKKMKEIKTKSKEKLKEQIKELNIRLALVDKQVYENVLLGELNVRIKQEGIKGVEITDEQIEEYYKDYARKLKILNPAAKVPPVDDVKDQIKAILIEESLLEKLRKQSKVIVKEETFRKLYGEKEDIVIE